MKNALLGQLGGIALAVFALSLLLTAAALRFALHRGLFDVPNERSSHSVPVPRSGGIAIVIAVLLGVLSLGATSLIDTPLALAFAGGGALVAAIGFADDHGHVPAGIRLATHLAAAGWALYCLGGMPVLQFGNHLIDLGWPGHGLAALGIVWSLNLFNFMDGIDGIAASQATCVAWSAAALGVAQSNIGSSGAIAVLLGAGALGFLPWNWPRAKLFMGDVGSGFIGFSIAVLALAASRGQPTVLFTWMILCGVFLTDATVTLARRLARGERPHVAHRSHAYQQLARRYGHRRVTVGVIAVNLFWLLPFATLSVKQPAAAVWLAVVALLPLIVAALALGAGRHEVS